MALDLILNSDLQLFRINEFNDILWLGYAQISKLWWLKDGQTRLKIHGALGKGIESIQDGDSIQILYKPAGRRDEYISSQVVARLLNCQIKRRWLMNIQPQSPDCQEVAMLYVSIICKIEMFGDK